MIYGAGLTILNSYLYQHFNTRINYDVTSNVYQTTYLYIILLFFFCSHTCSNKTEMLFLLPWLTDYIAPSDIMKIVKFDFTS